MHPFGALTDGRQAAESLMLDTCVIRRKTGRTTNGTTGKVTDTYGSPIYEGPCKLQMRDAQPFVAEAGDRSVVLSRQELHLPIRATGIRVDDVATVTAVGPITDPDNLGRKLRVRGEMTKSMPTARRLAVEEAQS